MKKDKRFYSRLFQWRREWNSWVSEIRGEREKGPGWVLMSLEYDKLEIFILKSGEEGQGVEVGKLTFNLG